MAVIRPPYSYDRATEIYRTSNVRSAKELPRADTRPKPDSAVKADTVRFSQEALERSNSLKQKQKDDPLEAARMVEEEDARLKNSLRVLEMDSDAGIDEIRKAYLHAIQHYHPDKHAYLPPEFRDLAEARTKRLNELYNALMKRKMDDS